MGGCSRRVSDCACYNGKLKSPALHPRSVDRDHPPRHIPPLPDAENKAIARAAIGAGRQSDECDSRVIFGSGAAGGDGSGRSLRTERALDQLAAPGLA